MKKKRIYIPASLPPPYNGQNVGTKLMCDLLSSRYNVKIFKWNIKWYPTDNANILDKVVYYFAAFFKYTLTIFKVWLLFLIQWPKMMYIVPSSNKKGFFRDILLYLPFILTNKKIICHIRSGSFNIKNFPFNYIYKFDLFHYIFLTENLKEISGVNKNYNVIANFIDPIFEKNLSSGNTTKPINIIYLSNLFESKGIFEVIKALKDRNVKDDFRLKIFGKGEHEVIKKILGMIKPHSNIEFCGEISERAKVQKELANADIFILPTTYPIEASPRSIIEALSQNTVPIVTNHAGIPNMVDGASAYLIDKNKDLSSQIIDTLNFISNNSDDLKAKKNYTRQLFEKKYSYITLKNEIISLFKENENS